jgi:hypothetical protein
VELRSGSGCFPEFRDARVGTFFAIFSLFAVVTVVTILTLVAVFARCGARTRSFFRDCCDDVVGRWTRDLSGPAVEELLSPKLGRR